MLQFSQVDYAVYNLFASVQALFKIKRSQMFIVVFYTDSDVVQGVQVFIMICVIKGGFNMLQRSLERLYPLKGGQN